MLTTICGCRRCASNIYWCDPEVVPVETDAHFWFTVALKADGWDVAGQVTADYCPALNRICP